MLARVPIRFWGQAAVLLLLTACNLSELVDPTPTPTLTLEEIEALAGPALIAEEEMTESARPSDTPTPPEPSPTATNTPVTSTEVPTVAPSCLVVASALNLRYGPGVAYEPPLKTLPAGTVLLPFAKNGDGSWLEVQLEGELTAGWVSAGGQFISCNFDPSGLPQGQIPPTPAPTSTLKLTDIPTSSPTFEPSE
ncbi:MAG: SH3 domain-containing protein [Chloroflexi bacterium]|nr:SH3 domain-containing protein [Chloroflexota bacterium]